MSAAPNLIQEGNIETPIKMKMIDDLKAIYKEILIKHLDERKIKEEKIYSWMNNILIDAKDYFIKKYPDYDIFLYTYIYPKNVYFRSNYTSISLTNTDSISSVSLRTDDLFGILYFFFLSIII